ncbi:MAG: helicase-associated domain-containing protein [Anaerolineales bacterium]|nr:helicase-associated domain-containing protein [Anaerolineales bacterium]
MPPLERVLADYDAGLLRRVAELWAVELSPASQKELAQELQLALLNAERVAAMVNALPVEARTALEAVRQAGGRVPLATFTRSYGEVRAMGPARREREQPWANSPSPAEVLWYRAITAHGFFESGGPAQEYVFIPDDLLKLIPEPPAPPPPPPPGHAVPAPETFTAAEPWLADDVVTLLAFAQSVPLKLEGGTHTTKLPASVRHFLRMPEALDLCFQLALELKLLTGRPLKPDAAQVRPFLEQPRWGQARELAEAWRNSKNWNDLRRLPHLTFEGSNWHNEPISARAAILKLLAEVPSGEWWDLDSFIAAVKTRLPDFQRPAGEYESWYIREAATGAYRRGFENWDAVDGALVRFYIEGPLKWLGMIDVGADGHPPVTNKFRLTPAGATFLHQQPSPAEIEAEKIHIGSNGVVRVALNTNAYLRFRVARVTKWMTLSEDAHLYRLTPSSLKRGVKQGVSLQRITQFLREVADEPGLPPTILAAMQRWARSGSEATIKDTTVLKLQNAELLETLQRTPRLKELLGQPLGPAAVEVRREDADRLRNLLAELGILAD